MNIVIGKLAIAITGGLLISGIIALGCLRIKYAKREASEIETKSKVFNKQEYVKKHRNIFGINERECSDIKQVFTVSPERMGL